MSIQYHPSLEQDIAEALKYYDEVSPIVGDEFKKELRHFIKLAAAHPRRFHPVSPKFRRANLKRFPYHFLYCEIPDGIRVMLAGITSGIQITERSASKSLQKIVKLVMN